MAFPGSCPYSSALLLLQLGPSRVEIVDRFLSLFHLNASLPQKGGIACDCGIFKRSTFRVNLAFLFGDALFDGRKFAAFNIGKLFLPYGCLRTCCRARAAGSAAQVRIPFRLPGALPDIPLRIIGKTFRATQTVKAKH